MPRHARHSSPPAIRARVLLAVVAAVACGALPACESAPATDAALEPARRDSAGIGIVEYDPLDGVLPTLVLDSTPALALGGLRTNLDEELGVRSPWMPVVGLEDGGVIVGDGTMLKQFDAAGHLQRTIGREGRGPGEFQSVRFLCRVGADTLVAVEYTAPTVSVWTTAGTFVGSGRMPGPVASTGCLADGSLIAELPRRGDNTAGTAAVAVRVRPDGAIVDTIGVLPASDYGPITREVSVIAAGDAVYVGEGRRYEVRRLGPGGRTQQILRVRVPPRPVDAADFRARLEMTIPASVQGPQREAQLAQLASMPKPESWPAYRAVRVDPRGRLWIEAYETDPDAPAHWTVFDASLRPVGRLTLPRERGDIVDFVGDRVALRSRDADGAVHLDIVGVHVDSISSR